MTQRVMDEFGNRYVSLTSYRLDANWNVVGGEAPMDHGLLLDNSEGHRDRKLYDGLSPEIETGAGADVGARIVMGLHNNQSPPSRYYDEEVMDVVRITTQTDSHSLELLGTGRVGHSAWYPPGSSSPHTDRGRFAMPDPSGEFLDTGEYWVNGNDWRIYYQVVTDTNSDGDCTDDDEDYLTYSNKYETPQWLEDSEFLGNRWYFASSWAQNFVPDPANPGEYLGEGDVIGYFERLPDGSLVEAKPFFWVDSSQTEYGELGLNPLCQQMVAAVIDGHDAVWVVNHTQQKIDGPNGQPEISDLLFAIDLNDDGDAMDAGEYSVIYSDDSAAGDHNNPNFNGWSDLEFIKHNGKQFLLIQNTAEDQYIGQQMLVMELLDNGDYVGGDAGIKQVFHTMGTGYEIGLEIEFDAVTGGSPDIPGDADGDGKVDGSDLAIWQQNYDPVGVNRNIWEMGDWDGNGKIDGADLALWQQNYDPVGTGVGAVPEPATMLLLGTGVLSALGYVRRRRLS